MKKKNSTPTPHDATFRQFLTQPEIARDFMEIHLPAELRAICDLSTLKLESGSFVEDDLRQYFSDVLYGVETVEGTGYVHVLIEHLCGAPHKCSYEKRMIMWSTQNPSYKEARFSVLNTQHKKTP